MQPYSTNSRILIPLLVLLLFAICGAADEVHVVTIDDAIGPATSDHFVRSLEEATAAEAELLVVRLNTPGGLVSSMRVMIEAILASTIPVATFVAPDGAHAASAGTYLTYASHIAAMCPVSNIGSSTPVSVGGSLSQQLAFPSLPNFQNPDSDSDESNEENDAPKEPSAMEKKVMEDAVAYIRSLAELRKRNADWAELSVREAANLTSSEALELNVVEYIATDVADLLTQIHGKTIANVGGNEVTLNTLDATVVEIETDWRYEILKILTNPNIAYLLLIVGINAIIIELYNPGLGGAGILGIICLLLGAYAMHMLPINYAGIALVAVGLVLFIAEALTPSYGIFGLGGIIAFGAGSLLLMDTDIPTFQISMGLVFGITTVTALLMIFVVRAAVKHWKRGPVSGLEAIVGQEATVAEDFATKGRVFTDGEYWNAVCDEPLTKDETVIIKKIDGLTLTVEKVT